MQPGLNFVPVIVIVTFSEPDTGLVIVDGDRADTVGIGADTVGSDAPSVKLTSYSDPPSFIVIIIELDDRFTSTY